MKRTATIAALLLVAAAPTEDVLVSDFDDGTLKASFGQAWAPSGDVLVGGNSMATLRVVDGERGHGKAMRVEATVVLSPKSRVRWAGALFLPGDNALDAKDLSRHHELAFRARGDGGEYIVEIYAQHRGGMPARATFTAGPSWSEVRLPFAAFDDIDGHDVTGILLGRDRAGAFTLDVDEVRLRASAGE